MSNYTGLVLVPTRTGYHLIQNGNTLVLTKDQAQRMFKEELLDGQTRFIKI